MGKLQYQEKINLYNLKYLLSVSGEMLKETIDPSGEKFCKEDGERIYSDIDVYIAMFKKWGKNVLQIAKSQGDNSITSTYSHSKNLVSQGRIYVKGFGVQKLKKNLRGFLVHDYAVDLDMKNCHPCLLLNLMETTYPDSQELYSHLKDYVHNRDKLIEQGRVSKTDVLISMNHNKECRSHSQFATKLDKEFKNIQKLLFNDYPDKVKLNDISLSVKNNLKQNKYGKWLNHLLTIKEDEILQRVMSKYKGSVHAPFFDGFLLDKEAFTENTIEDLNKMTESEGIKWSVKEHDTSIKIDEGIEMTFKETLTYAQQKKIFERNHFLVENPVTYGRTYKVRGVEKYQLYPKEKFRELVKPIKYFNGEKDTEFFSDWLEDEDRRSYKEINFIPQHLGESDVFNSFKGFNYEGDSEWSESDALIKAFQEHISVLVGNEAQASDYVLKYIAHLIQKPQHKPNTAIIIKSREGYGKDTLLDILSDLLGAKYFHRTADLDDIFGNYNVDIREKLILQLNEVQGKDGYSQKEKIKNLITEENTIIREKYISNITQKNYIRLFIFSNNLNPIQISHDDRRFTVFKSKRKPSAEYFRRLHGLRKDKEQLERLMSYLNTLDISNFSPERDRPRTKAYENMRNHNQNPLYKFLHDCFIEGNHKEFFDLCQVKQRKSDKSYLVKAHDLFTVYSEYLHEVDMGYIKPNFRILKSLLGDVGIERKGIKINNKNEKCYVINPDDLSDQMYDFELEEEMEELNDDDFV